ncbi:phosphatase PAP2 family protein [Aetokthonos hydrillicola Thurmond2011]|jgi:hypothetical protein|uniref:Phosphatase PAP2 family protein n=1 Tax=Aetokthonos hydrillicola Thurmond2011 TaxID=2712845 RepID=A0AAP5MB22_9CYAN|nr:CARDB domain-containing protein [Aetokthonos hydrillicola]MBO3461070.1 phosphatase PAP2 family protein [Aetokthonos hydrillicola CCALA 1050]MBW4586324.1 phosphatase PAP2 family protein [Aetokthonos hydrillicola CCALA 1050]MDR9897452.1 phosphatase PAP2 family protein [Aetokthonos hydrillicola Thurmond2011]
MQPAVDASILSQFSPRMSHSISFSGQQPVPPWHNKRLRSKLASRDCNNKNCDQSGLPNLTIKIKTIKTPTIFPEKQGKLQLIITNEGSGNFEGSFDVNLYASTDSVLDLPLNQGNLAGKDELLGTIHSRTNNLRSGQSKTLIVQFANSEIRTPSVVAPGAYYLIAAVDSNNTINQSNTTNKAVEFISTEGTDAVIRWNAIALNTIQATLTPTLFVSRNLAIVHTAIYDAANAIYQTHKPYLVNVDPSEVGNASPEAAVVEAAYEVLVNLYPTQKAVLDQQQLISLAQIPDGAAKDAGIALGKRVADQIIALRSNDGSAQATQPPYSLPPSPGIWRPTPPNFSVAANPNWGKVTPFAIPSGSAFRPSGFPALESIAYAQEFNTVKTLGAANSTIRTPEQTEIAKFWAYGRADTFATPGALNSLAEGIALHHGNTLEENVRLFALLNIAEADAGIAAYDAKYTFNRWRPITAIQEADTATNPNTVPDPTWNSLLVTPSHPDYLAAHAVFGGAASKILSDFFGENTSFTATSQELPGVFHSYNSFTQLAQEVGASRIYGGVHFPSAVEDGITTGIAVGEFVSRNALPPSGRGSSRK